MNWTPVLWMDRPERWTFVFKLPWSFLKPLVIHLQSHLSRHMQCNKNKPIHTNPWPHESPGLASSFARMFFPQISMCIACSITATWRCFAQKALLPWPQYLTQLSVVPTNGSRYHDQFFLFAPVPITIVRKYNVLIGYVYCLSSSPEYQLPEDEDCYLLVSQ